MNWLCQATYAREALFYVSILSCFLWDCYIEFQDIPHIQVAEIMEGKKSTFSNHSTEYKRNTESLSNSSEGWFI